MALRIDEESPNPRFLDDLEEYQLDGFEGRCEEKSKSTVFWTILRNISWFGGISTRWL
jgi:hypothetical protein